MIDFTQQIQRISNENTFSVLYVSCDSKRITYWIYHCNVSV